MNDPYAVDFPAAMLAAVRWSYVPVQQIGSYAAVPNYVDGAALRNEIPEFKLLLAILDDAVIIIQDGRQRCNRGIAFPKHSLTTGEQEFYDAVRWVMGLDKMESDQFSFAFICSALDLDVDAARDELLHGPIENCTTRLICGNRRKGHRATTSTMGVLQ
jgi:hypothetical protein